MFTKVYFYNPFYPFLHSSVFLQKTPLSFFSPPLIFIMLVVFTSCDWSCKRSVESVEDASSPVHSLFVHNSSLFCYVAHMFEHMQYQYSIVYCNILWHAAHWTQHCVYERNCQESPDVILLTSFRDIHKRSLLLPQIKAQLTCLISRCWHQSSDPTIGDGICFSQYVKGQNIQNIYMQLNNESHINWPLRSMF